jgi:hypothetical protein
MPLIPAKPTDASLRALETGLRGIARRGLPANLARAHARLAIRSVVATRRAVRLYHVRLADLAAGHSPAETAQAVGWRFFVPGLRMGQAAEVRRIGGRFEMTCWLEGPDNRRFFELVDGLNAERCADRRYELRCLEVPGLHLLAVWAYRSPSEQWFVPVSLLPITLPVGQGFDGASFQAALTPRASEHLAAGPMTLA